MPEARALLGELERSTGPAFRRLNAAVAGLVDEWGLVSFAPLDYSDEESVGDVLAQARPGCHALCCVCVSFCILVAPSHPGRHLCGGKVAPMYATPCPVHRQGYDACSSGHTAGARMCMSLCGWERNMRVYLAIAHLRMCAHGGRWITPSSLERMRMSRSATWAWASWAAMTSERPLPWRIRQELGRSNACAQHGRQPLVCFCASPYKLCSSVQY